MAKWIIIGIAIFIILIIVILKMRKKEEDLFSRGFNVSRGFSNCCKKFLGKFGGGA
ncbi:MAG: hypothetical protein AABY22_28895 [Nanoarchaeota archaeon]